MPLKKTFKSSKIKIVSLVCSIQFLLASFMCCGAVSKISTSDAGYRQWNDRYGKLVDMNAWKTNNPMPYTNYFPKTNPEGLKRWHISLGPLGVNTLMHDRTWTSAFKGCNEIAPIELMDECGQIKSTYEVTIVKPGGPAEGILQKGDLILQMDGQDLKEAQLTYLG
ncbi:MAG: PDZ domain-containing protein, partial [Lentisphaeraceae bacterium]|nr:PDZ domain-containing protein [Lentisphaeraceae bacterium]